jgi:uncharacterized protein (DUF1778 family)
MAETMKHDNGRKSDRLGLRASESQTELLRAASQVEGTTVSEFVLRHATRAAENVLADRRVFMLPTQTWDEFSNILDRPEQEVPKLRDLMQSPSVLD